MDSNDEVVVEQADSVEQTDDTAERTDWKAKAIELEAKFKAENGIRRRLEKDLKQYNKPEPSTEAKPQQEKGFDYGQLAYLTANGITEADDQAWLESIVKDSKLELKDVLTKTWVQAELNERKELRTSDAATPSGSSRAGNSARDTVDYWLAKGELPPADQPALRQKVVNAKIAAQKNKADVFGTATDIVIK